jgi:serine/threonine protein kinase
MKSDERRVAPERWQKIEQFYHFALGKEQGQRVEYLRQACAGDDELRHEVESLLSQGTAAAGFLEGPAVDLAARMVAENSGRSLIGSQIGSYQILSLLGAGGMGEVYRARDTRLDRDVALKVLPAGLLADEAVRRRFRKEALALAKLNHPHIAVIHDVGEEAGVDYLVMECVPGQSLAEKLKSGALPEKEVASLGAQIADALEEAHEHGVIHRDLKPGNIMITPKAQVKVKVLDFGLAKLLRPPANITAAGTMATESFAETHGVAGTLPYMAPEQLTGEIAGVSPCWVSLPLKIARTPSLAISAELIDARNDDHIWGQQYNRKLADIFVLQEEITKEITDRLRVRLTGEEQKHLDKQYTVNPEAYQDYLKGRYWWNKRTEEGLNKGIEYFKEAIEKDPAYAFAYAGLADSYSQLALYDIVPPSEAYPRAKEAALKSLEMDDTLAEAHTSLALIKTYYDWDWSGAEREFQRAIALNPNYAIAHQWYGEALRMMGRPQDGV